MTNKYAEKFPGLYSGSLPDIQFPVGCSNIGFELVSAANSTTDWGLAVVRYVGFSLQSIPKLLEEAGVEFQNFTKALDVEIVAEVKKDHPWFSALTPKNYPHDAVWMQVDGVKYCRFMIAPEGVYPCIIANRLSEINADETLNPLWSQNPPNPLADSHLRSICGGFNVASADTGGDPTDQNNQDGIASVDFVGWNPNHYLPWNLKHVGLELWDGTCGDSTQSLKFSVDSTHPWFQQLVPEGYPHGAVWVSVNELRYVKMSGWVPDGIYHEKASKFIYQQKRLRSEEEI